MNFNNILSFLSDLSENNNREWFSDNKEKYLQVKTEFDQIIQKFIPHVSSIDSTIGAIEAKDCVFRIYRDVRFSKNKDPYKIHFGAYISKDGRKGKNAGYYLHIQPGQSFLAAGAYMPEAEILKEIRYEIFEKINEFNQIIENKQFNKYFSKIEGDKLKTNPKGFPKDFQYIELLKLKSFEITHKIADDKLTSVNIEEYLLKLVEIAHPYNSFFNRVISNTLENNE